MATVKLDDFKIAKDQRPDGVKRLLKIIKPSWATDTIEIETMSGGYLNVLFRCYVKNNPEDAVTIRIRETTADLTHFNNEIELQMIQYMSKIGRFPAIHAIFSNGYCYQYVKGTPMLDAKKFIGDIDDNMLSRVAKELAFIHSVKLEGVNYNEDQFLPKMEGITNAVKFDHKVWKNEKILAELRLVAKFLKKLNSPIVTCHGDTHFGNFVWNPQDEKLVFVDWEMSYIGYQLLDIAYLLYLVTLFENRAKMVPTARFSFPTNYITKFLEIYYKEWCSLQKQPFTKEKFMNFTESASKFQLGIDLNVIVYSLTFPDVVKEFAGDVDLFIDMHTMMYIEDKKRILGYGEFEPIS